MRKFETGNIYKDSFLSDGNYTVETAFKCTKRTEKFVTFENECTGEVKRTKILNCCNDHETVSFKGNYLTA